MFGRRNHLLWKAIAVLVIGSYGHSIGAGVDVIASRQEYWLTGKWIVVCDGTVSNSEGIADYPLRMAISNSGEQLTIIGTYIRRSRDGQRSAGEVRYDYFFDGSRISLDGTISERDGIVTVAGRGGYQQRYQVQADGSLAVRASASNGRELWRALYLRER